MDMRRVDPSNPFIPYDPNPAILAENSRRYLFLRLWAPRHAIPVFEDLILNNVCLILQLKPDLTGRNVGEAIGLVQPKITIPRLNYAADLSEFVIIAGEDHMKSIPLEDRKSFLAAHPNLTLPSPKGSYVAKGQSVSSREGTDALSINEHHLISRVANPDSLTRVGP